MQNIKNTKMQKRKQCLSTAPVSYNIKNNKYRKVQNISFICLIHPNNTASIYSYQLETLSCLSGKSVPYSQLLHFLSFSCILETGSGGILCSCLNTFSGSTLVLIFTNLLKLSLKYMLPQEVA